MKNSPKVQIKVVKAKKSVNAKKTKKAMDTLKKTEGSSLEESMAGMLRRTVH